MNEIVLGILILSLLSSTLVAAIHDWLDSELSR
jgi:hypothetical protein